MRNSIFRICLACFFLVSASFVHAQDFSNKGKDFWITFPAHVDANQAVMGLYITSDKAATGQVSAGGTVIPFSITPNSVRRIFLGPNGDAPNTSVYLSQLEGILNNAGIRVTADQPVVVYAHIIRSSRSAATLVLPTTVWGREYLVPSYRSAGASGANSGFPAITVVAKEANTIVEITPTVASRAGQPAGVPYTITLTNPGDVYQVQYIKDADISGTKVQSIAGATGGCKPIAVFSSTSWSAFDCTGASGGDNLFQQLFPVRSFGRSFLTAPFIRKSYDIFRVFVTDPATKVTRTENGVTTTLTGLQSNTYYEFKTSFPNKIDGDKPISVVQYMTSQSCGPTGTNTVQSDPEMVVLNPVEQTINNITVFSAHQSWVPPLQSNVDKCYLNIIINNVAAPSFRINGVPPTGTFLPIAGTSYSYLQEDVTTRTISNPIQTLTADSSFSAIAYGYGNVESYGYNAGTNVRDLFQYVTIKNPFSSVNFPATCANAPFNLSITLPYKATQLKWLFYGRFNDTTITNPVPDSSFVVEGRTLYTFKLKRDYVIPSVGLYKVSVVANNPSSDGCSGEQQIDYEVEVFSPPAAKFSWQHTGCVTDSVRFIDQSSGAGRTITSWKWQFGDNTSDSVKNPVKKYKDPAVYPVKETIITDIGCFADTTILMDVSLPPVAGFKLSAPLCVGSKITVTDTSSAPSGTLKKWYWDFGNNRKDTLLSNTPFDITYATTGTYTITLVVESQSGCKSVAFTKTITINPYPKVDFSLPASVCLPSGLAAFDDLSTIADGTENQFVYRWDFGDGGIDSVKKAIHKYKALGPFPVKLTVTSGAGCTSDSTKTLSAVFSQPKSGMVIPAEVCFRDTSRFTDASTAVNQTIVKHYWSFGDNTLDSAVNTQRRYLLADTFTVRHWVISDKGCPGDTVSGKHIVNPLPVPDFDTSRPLCETRQLLITDKSKPLAGSLVRWQWDLGDNTRPDLSNGNPFQHTYAAWGNKTISLVVTTSKGCVSDTVRKTIVVHPLPKPQFVLPEVCLNDAFAVFTNTTTIADSSMAGLSWSWQFGDPNASAANPNTSTSKNPQHRYSAVGSYPVTLRVLSAAGCVDSLTQNLVVNGDKPKADFAVLNAGGLCSNIPVNIENKSSVNFGRVTKTEVYWEWPNTAIKTVDDDPTDGKIYAHLYPNFQSPFTKTIQIKLVAYSGGVCVSETIQNITLNASPKVVINTIPGICLDAAPRLISQASDAAGLPGSGRYSGTGIASGGLFTPTIPGVGTHTLQYLYVSAIGCRDSATAPVTVWPRPKAGFTIDSPTCEARPVTFRDTSRANFSAIASWIWDFGNGDRDTLKTGVPFSHIYASTGKYRVRLQVITDSGCTSLPDSNYVNINAVPKVDFTLPVVCMPTGKAVFTNLTTISDGSLAQLGYLWNFGVPGAGSTQKDPQYNYPAVGSYAVKLVVTSKDGCRDSLTRVLTDVNPQPLANFDITPPEACLGTSMVFRDRSNPLSQVITGRFWSFGDGQSDTTLQPVYTYRQAGNFNASFYYVTNKGCFSDTLRKPLVIHPYPVVNAGPDMVVLEGGQAVIKASATGSSTYRYKWTPDLYLSSDTILQPLTKPLADITYRLTVTGTGGCEASDEVFVKLLLKPEVPTAFSPNGDGINDIWNIKYLNSYPGAVIQVFDRYGRPVFSSTGYNIPWDGKFQGQDLPVGVYYYILDPKNGRKATSGSVTIIR